MAVGVGVIGVGTVGAGVVQALQSNSELIAARAGEPVTVAHVCDRVPDAIARLKLNKVRTSNDANDLIADPSVNVVCELIGGLEPAKTIILNALRAGKHVVTANKMLLAHANVNQTGAPYIAEPRRKSSKQTHQSATCSGMRIL